MTRPPEGDPNDPRNDPPETRQFDPDFDPSAPSSQAYTEQQPGQPYPGPYTEPHQGGQPYPGPYTEPQYADPHYTGGSPYASSPYDAPAGGEPPRGSGSKGRTIGLALAALIALVVLGLVVVLVTRSGDGDSTSAASSSTTESTGPATTSETTSSSTTTTEETTSTTTTTQRSGTVTYQLTGNGDVVALTFRRGPGSPTVIPATGSPWSQRVQLEGTRASLSAIVVRGPVSCAILADGEQLAAATSQGGTLNCTADLAAE